MSTKINLHKLKKREKIIIIILISLSFQNIILYYIIKKHVPQPFLYVNYLLAYLLPILLIIKTRPRLNYYRIIYIYFVFIIFIISFLYLYNDVGTVIFSFTVYLALITAFFLNSFSLNNWMIVFKILAIIAIVSSIFLLIKEPINLEVALRRGYSWFKLFYFATLYWAVVPFVILSFLTKRNRFISSAYWFLAIVINLIFLKRFIIVDSGLLLLTILLMEKKNKAKVILPLFIMGFLFIGIVFYFYGDKTQILLNATTSRISNTSENLSSFDRLIEARNYFKTCKIYDYILGRGFASVQYGFGGAHFALHIGWFNFIFKGGILLLMLVLIPYLKLITLFRKRKYLPLEIQFSMWFLFVNFFMLAYGNMYNLSPSLLLFFYCIFNIMDYSPRKANNANLLKVN